jgi:hypothetical protein
VASRSSSYSFSTFVIGFLAGVAATLAVLILFGERPGRREAAEPPASAAPFTPRQARKAETAKRPLETLPPASAAPPDEQVQEDAAAAGLTSRSRTPPSQ